MKTTSSPARLAGMVALFGSFVAVVVFGVQDQGIDWAQREKEIQDAWGTAQMKKLYDAYSVFTINVDAKIVVFDRLGERTCTKRLLNGAESHEHDGAVVVTLTEEYIKKTSKSLAESATTTAQTEVSGKVAAGVEKLIKAGIEVGGYEVTASADR